MAGVAGIEPASTVLETDALPLNHTPIFNQYFSLLVYNITIKIEIYKRQCYSIFYEEEGCLFLLRGGENMNPIIKLTKELCKYNIEQMRISEWDKFALKYIIDEAITEQELMMGLACYKFMRGIA